MHRIADTYGPLVYHQLGETPRVYGLQEAYTRFFADLDEGQQLIREYLDEGGDNNKFKEYDMLTNGKTLKEWLKFANSLTFAPCHAHLQCRCNTCQRPSNQSTE